MPGYPTYSPYNRPDPAKGDPIFNDGEIAQVRSFAPDVAAVLRQLNTLNALAGDIKDGRRTDEQQRAADEGQRIAAQIVEHAIDRRLCLTSAGNLIIETDRRGHAVSNAINRLLLVPAIQDELKRRTERAAAAAGNQSDNPYGAPLSDYWLTLPYGVADLDAGRGHTPAAYPYLSVTETPAPETSEPPDAP